MKITIPIKTLNVSNQREHWAVRQKRVKGQREAVAWSVLAQAPSIELIEDGLKQGKAFHITLTRIAPRMLDQHDGLPCALKPIADEVAKQLGVDDRDKRVEWRYAQCRGKVREYAVQIEINAAQPVLDHQKGQ